VAPAVTEVVQIDAAGARLGEIVGERHVPVGAFGVFSFEHVVVQRDPDALAIAFAADLEFVQVGIFPTHRVADGAVQIPECVLLGSWIRRQICGMTPSSVIVNWCTVALGFLTDALVDLSALMPAAAGADVPNDWLNTVAPRTQAFSSCTTLWLSRCGSLIRPLAWRSSASHGRDFQTVGLPNCCALALKQSRAGTSWSSKSVLS
jgi:hypothetical protein